MVTLRNFDKEGQVYGCPEMIEIDMIIQSERLILCEFRTSMSKSDVYAFERKVRFYEKDQGKKAERMLVISPMLDPKARETAKKLGVEAYSSARYVKTQEEQ